ncbi:zinc finger MYM-type protein 1-like protein [Tanacetum coccineum]
MDVPRIPMVLTRLLLCPTEQQFCQKMTLAKADVPLYRKDFIGGKPTGRFSNGETVADFLEESLAYLFTTTSNSHVKATISIGLYSTNLLYDKRICQLQELNNRFIESVSQLLRLSATLDPRKSFNSDDICKLVPKYYPLDFTHQDKIELKLELQHYELDNDPKLKSVTSLSQLYKGLLVHETRFGPNDNR